MNNNSYSYINSVFNRYLSSLSVRLCLLQLTNLI